MIRCQLAAQVLAIRLSWIFIAVVIAPYRDVFHVDPMRRDTQKNLGRLAGSGQNLVQHLERPHSILKQENRRVGSDDGSNDGTETV